MKPHITFYLMFIQHFQSLLTSFDLEHNEDIEEYFCCDLRYDWPRQIIETQQEFVFNRNDFTLRFTCWEYTGDTRFAQPVYIQRTSALHMRYDATIDNRDVCRVCWWAWLRERERVWETDFENAYHLIFDANSFARWRCGTIDNRVQCMGKTVDEFLYDGIQYFFAWARHDEDDESILQLFFLLPDKQWQIDLMNLTKTIDFQLIYSYLTF